MKKTLSTILTLSSLLVTASVFTACNKKNEEKKEEKQGDVSSPKEEDPKEEQKKSSDESTDGKSSKSEVEQASEDLNASRRGHHKRSPFSHRSSESYRMKNNKFSSNDLI